tara:strand:+ start:189 stop:434 length:246 start_codon:yes stop_codon:yes gene_type:complete
MWILFDFKCPKGHVEEKMVTSDITTRKCSCGLESKRVISPVRFKLDGTDSGFPDAYAKWGKDHEARGGDSEQTLDEAHSKG